MDNLISRLDIIKKDKGIIFLLSALIILLIIVVILVFSLFQRSKLKSAPEIPSSNPSNNSEAMKNLPDKRPIDEIKRSQSIADKKYGDTWTQIYENYPWYDNFPLHTEEYFVYFELESKKFIAKLYPNPNTPQRIENLKSSITVKLNEIDKDTAKYTIDWRINPQD